MSFIQSKTIKISKKHILIILKSVHCSVNNFSMLLKSSMQKHLRLKLLILVFHLELLVCGLELNVKDFLANNIGQQILTLLD